MLKNLKEDKKAKTPSFFFKKESEKFDKKYVTFLENFYKKNKKDVRICLHSKKNSKHHDMVILQQRKKATDMSEMQANILVMSTIVAKMK